LSAEKDGKTDRQAEMINRRQVDRRVNTKQTGKQEKVNRQAKRRVSRQAVIEKVKR
jgi:hypothetical protein